MISLKKSNNIFNRYKKYILKVTPFRRPILKEGEGSFFRDIDGNTYLDMMAGQFCAVTGNKDEYLNKLINNQINKIIHTNTLFLTEEVLKAAKELASITAGNLNKVIFLSTGSEAVECALRYAKFYKKKYEIVGIGAGYHGLTLAAQSVSTNGVWATPKVKGSNSIQTPDWIHSDQKMPQKKYIKYCLEKTRKQLLKKKGRIAAFILEPIISVGGMIYPPKEYFKGLKEIANEHDAILIFDECQTGLGRTGKWFAYEHYDITPDILVFAKGAGLGFPVSGIVVSDDIAKTVENNFIHFSSHQNDPISAVILEYIIKLIKKKNLLEQINIRGEYFLNKLKKLSLKESLLLNPRGMGLMIGFDLPEIDYPKRKLGLELMDIMEKNGVIIQAIRQGRTVRLLPNYLISERDIDYFILKLKESFKELRKNYNV